MLYRLYYIDYNELDVNQHLFRAGSARDLDQAQAYSNPIFSLVSAPFCWLSFGASPRSIASATQEIFTIESTKRAVWPQGTCNMFKTLHASLVRFYEGFHLVQAPGKAIKQPTRYSLFSLCALTKPSQFVVNL